MKVFAALAILTAFAAFSMTAQARETRTITDDTGTEVAIPDNPQRIVSLHDNVLTISLLELGVIPVGSSGFRNEDGAPYMRSARSLTGIDFGNSEIAFLGGSPADIEAIAALQPDLILTTQFQQTPVEQLRRIAPTVLIDYTKRSTWKTYGIVAEIVGEADQVAAMEARYAAVIENIRARIDTQNIKISTVHAHDRSLFVFNPYGNIGRVLHDAGFAQPQAILDVPLNTWTDVSSETLPAFDGDFIITTFAGSGGGTADDVRGYFEVLVPGYCDILHACRTGQMFVIPREEAWAYSYDALLATAYAIQSIVGGRPFKPMAD